MKTADLTFYVSHVQVEIRSDVDEVIVGLRAVWKHADFALRPVTRFERIDARAVGDAFEILVDDCMVQRTAYREDVLPLVEAALYAQVREWHAGHLLLHAACIRGPRGTLVLVGESGAGKSSMAKAALEAGYAYASDELTVSDGESVWGISRALQFDVVRTGNALPSWLALADVDSYRMRAFDADGGAIPLVDLPPGCVLRHAVPIDDCQLVLLTRGDDDVARELDALSALAALYEASLLPPASSLGKLARTGHAFALTWQHPRTALAVLEAALR